MTTSPPAPDQRGSLRAGLLIGVALMAGVDEILFHQVLGWHHFYDRGTPAFGLLTDGLLHAAELVALVAGFAWLIRLRGQGMLSREWVWPGLFLGLLRHLAVDAPSRPEAIPGACCVSGRSRTVMAALLLATELTCSGNEVPKGKPRLPP